MCESVSVIIRSTTYIHTYPLTSKHTNTHSMIVSEVQCFYLSFQVGILFDVDGVLLRGGSVIPAARRAFQKLLDQEKKNFRLPVVFVTNAGSCHRQHKARQLSQLLEVQVRTSQPRCYFILTSLSVTSHNPASAPLHPSSLCPDHPGTGGPFPQPSADVQKSPQQVRVGVRTRTSQKHCLYVSLSQDCLTIMGTEDCLSVSLPTCLTV